jgi:hypothetical protein
MPSKSKRNRRNISPNRNIVANADTNSTSVPASPVGQDMNLNTVYNTSPKSSPAAVPANINFARDIKWISLVTVILIICLVIAYIFFH